MSLKKFREPVSGLTHLAGAIAALIGLVVLIILTYDDIWLMGVMIVYGGSVSLTFSVSAIMHLYVGSRKVIRWLIRLDHAAIYIMIAGTYTPFCYVFLQGSAQAAMLAVIWVLAVIGVIYKLLRWHRDSILSTIYYLFMGWLGLLLLPQIWPVIPWEVALLTLAGGLAYTIGALVFMFRRPNFNEYWGFHEIWHLFVLAGAALHFFTILLFLA